MLTHVGTQDIQTEYLLLRQFQYADAGAVWKHWAADAQVQQLYAEPVYATLADVNGLLGNYINSYANADYYRWAVILQETGACIGQIAYFLVDSNNHFAELEYCIGRAFQRKGYATQAVEAVVRYGFDQIHLHKVQVCHKSANLPSRRVIEKCGFTYEGTLRDYFFENGVYEDRLYYSMLREEYDKVCACAHIL